MAGSIMRMLTEIMVNNSYEIVFQAEMSNV